MHNHTHADDVTKDFGETATAFTVSKIGEQSFSLQIHESKSKRTWLEAYIEAVSFRRIATVEQLQLEQLTHTHTHTHMHTHAHTCTHTHTVSFTVSLVRCVRQRA